MHAIYSAKFLRNTFLLNKRNCTPQQLRNKIAVAKEQLENIVSRESSIEKPESSENIDVDPEYKKIKDHEEFSKATAASEQMALAAGKAVTRVMHRCEAAKASGYLDLSDCGVMYIADAIYLVLKGYEIKKCNLRNNSLTKFPKKMVERFSNMIMFNVEGNAIEEFPIEVGGWTEMRGMNLSNNKLTTFPIGIFNMKQLTYLDLSGNNISEIDVDRLYTSLPNLTQLTLIGNPVAETMKTELENHKKKPKTLKLLLI